MIVPLVDCTGQPKLKLEQGGSNTPSYKFPIKEKFSLTL